uniref:AAA ATPase AAA+ lid domain-containing protein n=1 Tax=Ananas comosus var. bracteatus TaxID=296719 RepID=A0A6V7PY17_ANACO|nr:unnamed protein product [Ananas comosus var. bracteatus]
MCRIFVDLPNAGNRTKILKIILSKENLEAGFRYEELADATEGYSGSDLKNLRVAAAYKPVQELLEAEKVINLCLSIPFPFNHPALYAKMFFVLPSGIFSLP